jgi:hypothetical protein
MSKMINKNFFAIVLLLTSLVANADQGPPPPPAPPIGEDLPIDGNIYILLFISLAFGIYKIYSNKNLKTSK